MYWLGKDLIFPDYSEVSDEGIIALGGDLSPERLIMAYKKGIFPWFNEDEPILWWFPHDRFVLFPENLYVSKSMKKVFRDKQFTFTENKAFRDVIMNCAQATRKDQDGTWITNDMIEAYCTLHEMGVAKSIEVWQDDELVGGFYGVDMGHIFCGESMFAKVSNASKAGFIQFVAKYHKKYELIDCQVYTDHLASLGAIEIPSDIFLNYLEPQGE
ncbi:leucyl/phenylalanyl-tRNA--protein transferase [Faecalibacter sp. LW9]|uniref:leucyl/phenylalanyl-tRNA--protein transferase n=1 Tax=Faecalibacter sp. LW9 TaxID=3103144 RepID=UPI002AFE15C2|nr:leucyl/phenylalanyl-tRNA--protein transferase [Faecalibacter sp. LW9]